MVKTKGKSKSQKQIPKKRVSLELLHKRLGHRPTRSLLAGYNANVWLDIELRVDTDPFCTSWKISTINKKPISDTLLKSKTPLKWVFMDIISATYSKGLTKCTNFSNYLLIVDAYSNIPTLYGMENITTEEIMEKLDMFQAIFVKVDEFSWLDMEIIQTDTDTQFTSK